VLVSTSVQRLYLQDLRDGSSIVYLDITFNLDISFRKLVQDHASLFFPSLLVVQRSLQF